MRCSIAPPCAPPPGFLHASSLGVAILPLPHVWSSAGVNSDFKHKTKMAAASEDARMKNLTLPHLLGPAPWDLSRGVADGTQTRETAFN